MQVDGQDRSAHLHVPFAGLLPGRRVPLLLALHGSRGSGALMEAFSGFSMLADRFGFLAAYPDARGSQWAIHDSGARGAEDVEFIHRLIDSIAERYCVDRTRVFVAGVSNGGGEAARVGCSLAGALRGVALVAGSYGNEPPCRPSRPLSLIEIHSTTDSVVPFSAPGVGGVVNFLGMWRLLDHCGLPGRHRRLDAQSVVAAWTCRAGIRVSQVTLARGGHYWPGATTQGLAAPTPNSAASQIWAFFRSL
ncbi:MAG: hypothetical protein NVSMB51_10690 [Solirubrobacteraceae bacterium]